MLPCVAPSCTFVRHIIGLCSTICGLLLLSGGANNLKCLCACAVTLFHLRFSLARFCFIYLLLMLLVQYHILLENIEDAVKDFEKSVRLSPAFAIAHVQKCYTGNF